MEGHQLIAELCGFINRWPATKDTWKRVRIAVTAEELAEMLKWYRKDTDGTSINTIVHALRGVPLIVEEHPTTPLYIVEPK